MCDINNEGSPRVLTHTTRGDACGTHCDVDGLMRIYSMQYDQHVKSCTTNYFLMSMRLLKAYFARKIPESLPPVGLTFLWHVSHVITGTCLCSIRVARVSGRRGVVQGCTI